MSCFSNNKFSFLFLFILLKVLFPIFIIVIIEFLGCFLSFNIAILKIIFKFNFSFTDLINTNVDAALIQVWNFIIIASFTSLAHKIIVNIKFKIGFRGWSLEMAIPIIIIVANITMLILTIVSYKKYVRYAIYQLIICILSLLPIYFIYKHMVLNMILSYVAIGISILNFILTIILCARDVKEAIIIKFHTWWKTPKKKIDYLQ